MLLGRFYYTACRTQGQRGRSCLRWGFSCGRYMGFKERRQKPRPPRTRSGKVGVSDGWVFSFPTRTPLTWTPPSRGGSLHPFTIKTKRWWSMMEERETFNSKGLTRLSLPLFIAGTVLGVRVPPGNFDWRRPDRSGKDPSPLSRHLARPVPTPAGNRVRAGGSPPSFPPAS